MKVWVVDNGGQWTHREWRVLRYLKADTQMVPNDTPVEDLVAAGLDGILLSGGAPRVGVDGTLGNCADYIDQLDIPILGICAGHQFMARHFGGSAAPGKTPEFGAVDMDIVAPGGILDGIESPTQVWASHHDEVDVMPDDFEILASSETCPVQVMRHKTRPLYGMQYHPEVEHTPAGAQMFRNFLKICEDYAQKRAEAAA